MKLSEIKDILQTIDKVEFLLPNGTPVPPHFHVTEIGKINKHYIDCGGEVRNESVINFQLFTATDYDHRLSAHKLKSIVGLSEKALDLGNTDIEVEYQGDTIGKYSLDFRNGYFHLINKKTDCLAKDKCGIPQEKPKLRISSLPISTSTCTPGSGCC
ncbi:MAG: hypothetical protein HKN76_02725 [Saprospiraceae bacterium]|nr:hypothetical protein [Saprospiraceae bacterium]